MSDDIIDRIDKKLDKIDESLTRQGETLVRLTVTVEEHARRSDNLEQMYKHLDDKIEPIKTTVDKITGAFKFIGIFIIPIVAAVLSTMHFHFHIF